MKNILLTLILFIGSAAVFAAGERNYSLSIQSINNVNFGQRYTATVVCKSTDNALTLILTDKDFEFIGFTDTAGYVKNITGNTATLYIEFYRRETSAQINGVININFKAKASNDADELTLHSLSLPYSYKALTAVDPGKIAGPSGYHRPGEVPERIKSIYDAIPLSGTTVTYSWEKKLTNGTWSTIQGESSGTLIPHAMGHTSVLYRRKATDTAGNYAHSNTIEILPMLTAGEIGLSYSDLSSNMTLTNIVSPNSVDAEITWQSSIDLETWLTQQGSGTSLTTGKPTITTYYRRTVTAQANDTYGNPIKETSNIVCYFNGNPAGISTMNYFSADSAVTDIIYYDGLGRKLQSVSAKAAMDGKDIVVTEVYDKKGRRTGTSVPFCKAGNGEFAHNAGYKNRMYHGDSKATTLFTYESSPLDRIVRSYKPGEVYQGTGGGHYTAAEYGVNGENEVMRLNLTGNGFTVSGYHPAATLRKTTSTDEDGAQIELFTDSRGKTILERRKGGNNTNADTYYIYDSKERARCVVSPKGSAMLAQGATYSDTCDIVKELCYIYSYDNEDRIVMKRLPGRCAEYFGYDTQGRLSTYYDERMQQDGITKRYVYDALGRVEGFCYDGAESTCGQQWNHYDDYNVSGAAAFSPVSGVVAQSDLAASAKGMLTYDRTFELYGNWACEARERTYRYDSRGRCVQTYTAYPAGINCRTSIKYDYAGNPLTTVEQYTYGSSAITITTERTFDSRGRKLTELTTVNGNTVAHAAFAYDEMGRMTETSLNGNIEITADYNLQGWLTRLQASKKSDGFIISDVIFDETLRYHDTNDSLAVPLYAGKIAQLDWKRRMLICGNDRFLYRYDPQGRLIKAEHRITGIGNSTAGNYCEETEYDLNSNITSFNAVKEDENIQRVYTLNGNRIVGAEYDSRGNITRIPWENLQIAYNLINLPRSVTAADGTKIDYSYLSDGTKSLVTRRA